MIGDSEPPCPRDYVHYHSDYEPARGRHGGCAIFVRYDIAHMHVNLQTNLQAVAVQLHLEKNILYYHYICLQVALSLKEI